ncbi:hypothetical protein [Pseudophaeobacter sp. EL27]|uniref:hypothetical protein n=1 Tax=Pseudophaeobacter sp. EL27 TaxID=2107580 RepID=UPI0013C52402|nr:hypothetical protein [Pseudophaeobacter sp. EL27]
MEGIVMVKSVMFGAALIFAAGPGPLPVSENVVPLPMEIAVSEVGEARPQTVAMSAAAQTNQAVELVAPGSQKRVVQVLGRSLSLSLMRADRMGLAVLSVPKRSVISSLPVLELDAFRNLVAEESGCRPVGQVQVVGSRGGTLALATGLSCS